MSLWSLNPIMSLISSPSSLLIMCPYYLSLAPLIYSAMSTTPHILLISSSHHVADQLSFISSYYVSILSQPCSPHLLCNVYHSTCPCDLLIPSCRWSALLHLFLLCVHTISALLPSSTLHVYHSTCSSDLFIPSYRWSALLHLFILCVHTISALLPSYTLHVYHSTYSSHLFIPSYRWSALLHLLILCVHTISALLPSSTLQCLPL